MKDIKVFLKTYGRELYKNLPEDEKQKLVEYGKNIAKIRKNALLLLL